MGRATRYSWSHSRSAALKECPRRAFYEYYSEGEPEDRDCWKLKELTSLPMWAGSVVDFIITRALVEFQKSGSAKEGLAEFGVRHYWRGLERSPQIAEAMRERPRTKAERNGEPFRPLQHHYYRLDLGREYEVSMAGRVASCLSNFEGSETYDRIRSAGAAAWLPRTDSVPSFALQGHTIYTALDFAFRDGDDLHILDWKSGYEGERATESATRQLGVYALYGIYELKHPLDRIHTQAVWLQGSADWQPERPSKDGLRAIRDGIIAEVQAEHGLLDVREFPSRRREYRANRESFPTKPSSRTCLNCKFREICPEGAAACAHVAKM